MVIGVDQVRRIVMTMWQEVLNYLVDEIPAPKIEVGYVPYFQYDPKQHRLIYNPKTFGCVTLYELREVLLETLQDNINRDALRANQELYYYSGLAETVKNPILEKIRKLFALSSSSNPNEAMLALETARRLMCQHGINDLEDNSPFYLKSMGRTPCGLRVTRSTMRMIGSIIEHFDCRVIWGHTTFIDGGPARIITAHGTLTALKVADYVADFLKQEIDMFWNQHRNNTGAKGRTQKHAYQMGLLLRVHKRMKETKPHPNQYALIQVGKLDDFVDNLYPEIGTMRTRRSFGSDRDALHKGYQDGEHLHIRPGVGNSNPEILQLKG